MNHLKKSSAGSTLTNSGAVSVSGVLQIANGGTVNAATTTIWNTGTLAIGGSFTLNGPLTINGTLCGE